MIVSVNNLPVDTSPTASLGSLLTQLALIQKKGIAVAVNSIIIPRARWDQHPLSGNETITILQATQGG
jgi:sulfur carrier protein